MRGKKPITLQGTGDSVLTSIVFDRVSGEVETDRPLDIRSVSGLVFHDFLVTSGKGEETIPAVNVSDGWERVK